MSVPHILCTISAPAAPPAGSTARMTGPGDDYAARAADFRRLADSLDNERERAALLAIADQYEAVAAQLAGDESDF